MIVPPRAGQAPAWLSLAFFITGFLALAAAYALLLWNGDAVLRHYLLPEGVTLAHLTVLGWLSMVMMGALYQLVSVLVQAPLFSVKLAIVQYVTWVAGVYGLVESFARSRTASLPVHGATAIVAVLLFLLNLGLTFRRIRGWSVPARYLAASLGFLALTVTLGFLYALDLRYAWFSVTTHRLAVHAHLGIAGWMGLLLIGVSYRLLPMFLLVRGHDERLAKRNLWLIIGSLLALAVALLLDASRPWRLVPALGLGAGYLLYAWDAWRMFRARLRRRLDIYAWHLFASFAGLIAAVAAGLLTVTGLPQEWLGEVPWTLAYAYITLGGWLTLAIMGHCYKIVPMLTWQLRYGGRGGAPLLTEMYRHRLAAVALTLYAAGATGVTLSFMADSAATLRWTAAVAAAGVAAFLINMAHVLVGRHAPSTPAARAAPLGGVRTGGTP